MKQDRDNERISRRELLMALASVTTAGGAFVQFCMSDAGKRTVEIAGDAIPARFQTEYATKDVLALFPDFFAADGSSVFLAGNAHYKFPGTVHPDNGQALESLKCIAATQAQIVVRDRIEIREAKSPVVCVGSPTSNLVARAVMGYHYVDTRNPDRGLTRFRDGSKLVLPFDYELMTARLQNVGAHDTSRILNGHKHKVPNWSINDHVRDEMLLPEYTSNGTITKDYLLISVLPQVNAKGKVLNKNRILVVGGTHGIGTNGIDLLMKDRTALKSIAKRVDKARYWQALVPIVSQQKTATGPTTPFDIHRGGVRVELVRLMA